MKNSRIAWLLAVCMTATLALAQYGGQNRRHQMPSVDDQVNRLSETLNLSDSQKTQARDILQNQRDQMIAIRQDSSLSREDRRAKMMEIHQTTSGQIRGLLNEDQQKKYDAMVQERRQEWQSRRPGGGGMDDNH